jgi:hypothetical protein
LYLQYAQLQKGLRLNKIDLGSDEEDYINPAFNDIEITENNKLLEILDLTNLPNLTGSMPI